MKIKIVLFIVMILIPKSVFSVVYSTQPKNGYDTYLSQQYPDENQATAITSGTINTGGEGGTPYSARIIIKFNLSTIPSGSVCLGATMYLTLTYGDNLSSAREHSVYLLQSGRSDWVHTQATWNEYKSGSSWGTAGCSNTTTDYNPSAIGTFLSPTAYPQVSTIPLTASAIQPYFGGMNYGIMIKKDNETTTYTKREYASSRYGVDNAYLPRLDIEYTTPSPQNQQSIIIISGDGSY